MFTIELAGIRIRIDNRYPYLERLCRSYRVDGTDAAFSVSVTEEEILEESRNGDFPADCCEGICAYRKICEGLIPYRIFLMHSSVVEVDGFAYAFTAASGVGKSTHTKLWMKNIPGCRIINGDKPLYRWEEDGSFTVFGTPWNGKENWGENLSAPLSGILFLERGEVNLIRRAQEPEAIARLMPQLYLRGDREAVNLQLSMANALIRSVPFWVLACNISDDAARLAYQAVRKERKEGK